MAFTVDAIETPAIAVPTGPKEFDLPTREFVSYDKAAVKPKEEVAQTVTSEETAAAPVETEVALSPKISALARKEQAQRQREFALKKREQELADKLARADKYDQLKEKLAKGDFSAVETEGLEYDKYAEFKVKELEAKDPREERLLKHEQELAELKKQLEEKEVKEYQLNQQLWKNEISKTIETQEEFRTLKRDPGMVDLILQHINDSFEEDNVELSAEQATREIQQALRERKKKLDLILEDEETPAQKSLGPPKSSPKTITQNMTVTPKTLQSKPFHLMSESEQIAEAYRRVQEANLKKQRGL
jgi:hypothetical protein